MTDTLLPADVVPTAPAPVHRCAACGRPLTDPTSVARQVGPDCWLKDHPDAQPGPVRSTAGVGEPDLIDELGGDVVAPVRIQRQRTKGWRKPEGAIVVTRGTDWGNPFKVGSTMYLGRQEMPNVYVDQRLAVELFRARATALGWIPQIRAELAGKDLVCWCKPGTPCHADWLLATANGPEASA